MMQKTILLCSFMFFFIFSKSLCEIMRIRYKVTNIIFPEKFFVIFYFVNFVNKEVRSNFYFYMVLGEIITLFVIVNYNDVIIIV